MSGPKYVTVSKRSGGPSKPPMYFGGSHGNKVLPLTAKEREARRQAKQAAGHSVTASDFGFAQNNLSGADTVMSGLMTPFSPQLSTDFLQLPQSKREEREIFKHFYDNHAVVGSAIDLHTDLPLSKLRLTRPKPRTCPSNFTSPTDYGRYILYFYKNMVQNLNLFQNLIMATHHLNLDGGCYLYLQDQDVEIPEEVGHEIESVPVLLEDGTTTYEKRVSPKPDRDALETAYYQKHYKGWEKIIVLHLDQVSVTSFGFTDKVQIELVPSDRDREIVEKANQGDPFAQEIANDIPEDVRHYLETGELIPLNTDPMKGSCAVPYTFRRDVRDSEGQSLLKRVLRDLYLQDKVRQAQSMITDRSMTPRRIVTAEGASDDQIDDLREQVDLALMDPDYSIVVNTPVTWEEMSSRDRLLDDAQINEHVDRRIHVGLKVTDALLSGESLYSGDRIRLEIINIIYSLLRELIQDVIEKNIFIPVAYRKGFVEKNEWGDEVPIYPKVSFSRLALKDTQDLYDALFNLYQKGSVPIDVILELFNLDPGDIRERLEADLFTVNDSTFNEVLRSAYGDIGRKLVEEAPEIMERVAKALGISIPEKQEEAEGSGGGDDGGMRW